jgi:hypothetical protein
MKVFWGLNTKFSPENPLMALHFSQVPNLHALRLLQLSPSPKSAQTGR